MLVRSVRRGLARVGCRAEAGAQRWSRAPPREAGFKTEGIKKLDERLLRAVERNEIAGAVGLVVRDGKVAYFRGVGMRDREANAAMPTDAIFRIASMTKPVTSVAAMILVDDGKLSLDDPVAKYIPEFKDPKLLDGEPAGREITVRHLITHTSGLTYRFMGGPLGELYAKAGVSDGLSQTPGVIADGARLLAAWSRCSSSPGRRGTTASRTDVLGRVVEVASGKPLDVFFRERIFAPLKMDDTAFFPPPEKVRPDRATLYQPGPGAFTLRRAPESPITNGDAFVYSASYPYDGLAHLFLGRARG